MPYSAFQGSPAGILWAEFKSTVQTVYTIEDKKAENTEVCGDLAKIQEVFPKIDDILNSLSQGGQPTKDDIDSFVTTCLEFTTLPPFVKSKINLDISRLNLSAESQQEVDGLLEKIFLALWTYPNIESFAPFLNPDVPITLLALLSPYSSMISLLTLTRAAAEEQKEEESSRWCYKGSYGVWPAAGSISFDLDTRYQMIMPKFFNQLPFYQSDDPAMQLKPLSKLRFLNILAKTRAESLVMPDDKSKKIHERILAQVNNYFSLVSFEQQYIYNWQYIFQNNQFLEESLQAENDKKAVVLNQIHIASNKILENIREIFKSCIDQDSENPADDLGILNSALQTIDECQRNFSMTADNEKRIFQNFRAEIQNKILFIEDKMAAECDPEMYRQIMVNVGAEVEKNSVKKILLMNYFPEEKEVTTVNIEEKIVQLEGSLNHSQRSLDALHAIKKCIDDKANDNYFPFREIDAIIQSLGYGRINGIGTVQGDNEFFNKDFCWLLEDLGLIKASARVFDLSKQSKALQLLVNCRHTQSRRSPMSAEEYQQVKAFLTAEINKKILILEENVSSKKEDVTHLREMINEYKPDQDIKKSINDERSKLVPVYTNITKVCTMFEEFKSLSNAVSEINQKIDNYFDVEEKEGDAGLSKPIDYLLDVYCSNELTVLREKITQLKEDALSYINNPENAELIPEKDKKAITALVSMIDNKNPAEVFRKKIIDKCQHIWSQKQKAFFDAAQEELSRILSAPIVSDDERNMVLFLDRQMDTWLYRYRELPEEIVSEGNAQNYNNHVKGSREAYISQVEEQARRINQIKALRDPIIKMYEKGTELIDAGRETEGKDFRAIALELVRQSNQYIIDVNISQDAFCRDLSRTLSSDLRISSIKNFRIWPIVLGNILLACLTVGLSIPIQLGMYMRSGYVLFSKTDREYKVDRVKDVIKSKNWQSPEAKT